MPEPGTGLEISPGDAGEGPGRCRSPGERREPGRAHPGDRGWVFTPQWRCRTGLGVLQLIPWPGTEPLSPTPDLPEPGAGAAGVAHVEAVQGRKRRSGNSLEKQQEPNKRNARPFPAHQDELPSLAQRREGNRERHGHGAAVQDPATLCVPAPELQERVVPHNTQMQCQSTGRDLGNPRAHTAPGSCSLEPTLGQTPASGSGRAPAQLPAVTKGPSAAPCDRGGSGSAATGQGEAPAERRTDGKHQGLC